MTEEEFQEAKLKQRGLDLYPNETLEQYLTRQKKERENYKIKKQW